jgi:amino acid transporter
MQKSTNRRVLFFQYKNWYTLGVMQQKSKQLKDKPKRTNPLILILLIIGAIMGVIISLVIILGILLAWTCRGGADCAVILQALV